MFSQLTDVIRVTKLRVGKSLKFKQRHFIMGLHADRIPRVTLVASVTRIRVKLRL